MAWKKQESNEFWLPEKELEEIEGLIVDIKEGDFGKTYLIERKNGGKIMTPSHKVLQNRMVGITKGDQIKIVFVGEEPPKFKGHSPTRMYDVYKNE